MVSRESFGSFVLEEVKADEEAVLELKVLF